MCGFVGFTNYIKDDGTVLEKMMNRIVHRGPDSAGKFVDGDVALGFRRLSIIDLAEGDQPMFNEDKSLVLTFNGEIYNFKELREELIAAGHKFANNSDSEVLLHGYEQWGEKLVEKLGLVQVSDEGAIKEMINEVLANNPQSVADFKAGKDKAMGFLVGQTMKLSKGKANPQIINKLLREALENA